jgi:hypothetical protein
VLGSYDFCGYYDWTFRWLEKTGGHPLVRSFWDEAINRDSQRHARELILRDGFAGMAAYWGHTLTEESPERAFNITEDEGVFRIDMHDCPSKGFLLRNGLEHYRDYCDHCMGWIGPMVREGGFVIDHEHNHCGQCWWELRRAGDPTPATAPGQLAAEHDVRISSQWTATQTIFDRYVRTNDADDKKR